MANPTLQTYLTQTQRLLHDSNFKYWTQQTLIDAINTAQKRVVGDSGCNRQLQTIYLSGGLELYAYGSVSGCLVKSGGSGYVSPVVTFDPPSTAGGVTATGTVVLLNGAVSQILVTNGGNGYTTTPNAVVTDTGGGVGANLTASILNPNTLDTLSIATLWGTERIVLSRIAFTALQASIRSWVGYTQRPCYYSSYGQNGWYIGPIPDQFYASEWDTIINPTDLVNLTDVSVIQYPYSECVSYYAAHMAKFMEQSYAEAEKFLEYYQQKMRYSLRSVMMRQLPTSYGGA